MLGTYQPPPLHWCPARVMVQKSPNEAQSCHCLKTFHYARMSGKLYLLGFVLAGEKIDISQQEKRAIVFCDVPSYYKEAYGITRNFDSDLRNKMRQMKSDKQ